MEPCPAKRAALHQARVGLAQVFFVDFEDVGDGGQKVSGAEFGAGHVFPTFEGIFVDHAFDQGGVVIVAAEVAGDDFDVEDPFGEKGFGQDVADAFSPVIRAEAIALPL